MPSVLTTRRLILRPLTLRDAARIQRLCGELAVSRWLSSVPHPYPDGEAERFISSCLDEGACAWAIELKSDPVLIGILGLDGPRASATLGYWLGQRWWGRGVVSEAAEEVVRFGFEDLGFENLLSGAFEGNPPSLRIQEKLGFRITGERQMRCRALGCELRHIDTALTRIDWEATREEAGMGGIDA